MSSNETARLVGKLYDQCIKDLEHVVHIIKQLRESLCLEKKDDDQSDT